jgi:DNA-binding NarL/FixJ family response regulator
MRIAIAEDAALFRAGLVRLLEDEGHQVCAEVADGEALLAAVASQRPDVVVADIRMPPTFTDEGLHAGDLDPLTPRERDVLALMAEGRSNAGVAAALVLTLGTVEKHVASIFGKLGLPASETDNRRVLAVLRYLGS